MPFKDTPQGTTHYQNDGCGIPEHNLLKGWIVICSKNEGWRAFSDKKKAVEHKDLLNKEYEVCKHKVVACEIKLLK